MTVDLDVLDEALARFDTYCEQYDPQAVLEKQLSVDTLLHSHELNNTIMDKMHKF